MSYTLQAANIVFDSAGSTRIESLSPDNITFWANGTNVMSISGDNINIPGMTSNGTVIFSNSGPNLTPTGNLTVSGSMVISGSGSLTGNVQIAGNNLTTISATALQKNGVNLGTWTLINSISWSAISNIASPVMTGFKAIRVYLTGMTTANDGAIIKAHISIDGGISYLDSAASGYSYAYRIWNGANAFQADSGTFIPLIENAGAGGMGSASSDGGADAEFIFFNWDNGAANVSMQSQHVFYNSGAFEGGDHIVCICPGRGSNVTVFMLSASGVSNHTGSMLIEGLV